MEDKKSSEKDKKKGKSDDGPPEKKKAGPAQVYTHSLTHKCMGLRG